MDVSEANRTRALLSWATLARSRKHESSPEPWENNDETDILSVLFETRGALTRRSLEEEDHESLRDQAKKVVHQRLNSGGDADWVVEVYRSQIGRLPTYPEFEYALMCLRGGGVSREELIVRLHTRGQMDADPQQTGIRYLGSDASGEPLLLIREWELPEENAEFIATAYRLILRRDPDAPGAHDFHLALQQGTSRREALESLANSEEARILQCRVIVRERSVSLESMEALELQLEALSRALMALEYRVHTGEPSDN